MSEQIHPGDLPAYPMHIPDERDPNTGCGIRQGDTFTGVTKREYFAAAALQGLLASPAFCENPIERKANSIPISLSELAVFAADSLIAELERPRDEH